MDLKHHQWLLLYHERENMNVEDDEKKQDVFRFITLVIINRKWIRTLFLTVSFIRSYRHIVTQNICEHCYKPFGWAMLNFLKNQRSVIVDHLEGREGEGSGKRGFWGGEHMREWRDISHHKPSLKGETWLRIFTGNWLTFDKVREDH